MKMSKNWPSLGLKICTNKSHKLEKQDNKLMMVIITIYM